MPTLHWIGKEKVVTHHQDVPYRVLEHKYGFRSDPATGKGHETAEPTDSGNKIIHGDNLEALKSLLPEYEGKIKCIYIDPPYNTGNESWVYNDNVNHPKIKKWLGEVVGKDGEDFTRHDKWLCMMYPRLKLLHKLLAEDGAIFISIDDNEQANLRLMCDEIFGTINFINNIIWQKKYSPQNDARYLSDMHDFILCYTKHKDSWTRNLIPRNEKQNDRYKNPDKDKRGVWKSSDLSAKRVTEKDIYEIITPSGRKVLPPKGRSWVVSKGKFEELVQDNRIWFGKNGSNVPSVKKFLNEVQDGTVPVTLWLRDEVGDNQLGRQDLKNIFNDSNTPFDTPKPTNLIDRIIRLSSDKDSIILDSFAGSGTTAHAVLNLNKQDGGNRKFILVEMEDYANDITAERVKRVANGYGKEKRAVEGTGGAFDYYELGLPLFKKDDNLNEEVPEEEIRNYIYYTETKSKLKRPQSAEGKYLLDNHNGTGYYFYYEKETLTVLDIDTLNIVIEPQEQYIIYADVCLLDTKYLQDKNIIFKKIPRDITRF